MTVQFMQMVQPGLAVCPSELLHLSIREKLLQIIAVIQSQLELKLTGASKHLVFDALSCIILRTRYLKRDNSEWKLLAFTWFLSVLSWRLILQECQEAHVHTETDDSKHACASIYRRYKSEVRHCASLQNLIIGIF